MSQKSFVVSSENLSEPVIEARNCLGSYSPSRIAEIGASALQTISLSERDERTKVRASLLLPRHGEVDNSTVIVANNPFQQGADADHMTLRWMMAQKVIGNGQHPLLVFGEATISDRHYHEYSEEELVTIASGNVEPISSRRAAAIAELYPDNPRLIIIGYSLGAMVGARLANYFDASHVVLVEAPNTDEVRTKKQLKKDFNDFDDLQQAIVDAKMANLREIQGVGTEGETSARQLLGFARFGLGTFLKTNRALISGMATGTFYDDLADMPNETHKTIGRGQYSQIFSEESFGKLNDSDLADALVTMQGRAHGAGDNITLLAELFHQATLLDASA